MGACCGGMKPGQKSLPEKKQQKADVAAAEKQKDAPVKSLNASKAHEEPPCKESDVIKATPDGSADEKHINGIVNDGCPISTVAVQCTEATPQQSPSSEGDKTAMEEIVAAQIVTEAMEAAIAASTEESNQRDDVEKEKETAGSNGPNIISDEEALSEWMKVDTGNTLVIEESLPVSAGKPIEITDDSPLESSQQFNVESANPASEIDHVSVETNSAPQPLPAFEAPVQEIKNVDEGEEVQASYAGNTFSLPDAAQISNENFGFPEREEFPVKSADVTSENVSKDAGVDQVSEHVPISDVSVDLEVAEAVPVVNASADVTLQESTHFTAEEVPYPAQVYDSSDNTEVEAVPIVDKSADVSLQESTEGLSTEQVPNPVVYDGASEPVEAAEFIPIADKPVDVIPSQEPADASIVVASSDDISHNISDEQLPPKEENDFVHPVIAVDSQDAVVDSSLEQHGGDVLNHPDLIPEVRVDGPEDISEDATEVPDIKTSIETSPDVIDAEITEQTSPILAAAAAESANDLIETTPATDDQALVVEANQELDVLEEASNQRQQWWAAGGVSSEEPVDASAHAVESSLPPTDQSTTDKNVELLANDKVPSGEPLAEHSVVNGEVKADEPLVVDPVPNAELVSPNDSIDATTDSVLSPDDHIIKSSDAQVPLLTPEAEAGQQKGTTPSIDVAVTAQA